MLDATNIFDGTLPKTGIAITATRVSTNVLDFLVGRDLGAANPLRVNVLVTEAFATLTSLVVDLEVCDTAGGSYLAIVSTPVIPAAQLILGEQIARFVVPVNQVLNATAGVLKTPGQFWRLNYTVAGSNATAGKVFAWMAPAMDGDQYTTYPANYTAAVYAGEI